MFCKLRVNWSYKTSYIALFYTIFGINMFIPYFGASPYWDMYFICSETYFVCPPKFLAIPWIISKRVKIFIGNGVLAIPINMWNYRQSKK